MSLETPFLQQLSSTYCPVNALIDRYLAECDRATEAQDTLEEISFDFYQQKLSNPSAADLMNGLGYVTPQEGSALRSVWDADDAALGAFVRQQIKASFENDAELEAYEYLARAQAAAEHDDE